MEKSKESSKKLTKKQKIWIVVGAVLTIIIVATAILAIQKPRPEGLKIKTTTSEEDKKPEGDSSEETTEKLEGDSSEETTEKPKEKSTETSKPTTPAGPTPEQKARQSVESAWRDYSQSTFKITDSFVVSGRGTVVIGSMLRGTLRKGDQVKIQSNSGEVQLPILKITKSNQELTEANTGSGEIALTFSSSLDKSIGYIWSGNPKCAKTNGHVVRVYLFTKAEGNSLINEINRTTNQLMPLRYPTLSNEPGEMAILSGSSLVIRPGQVVEGEVNLFGSDSTELPPLVNGQKFEIVVGTPATVVGIGVITGAPDCPDPDYSS